MDATGEQGRAEWKVPSWVGQWAAKPVDEKVGWMGIGKAAPWVQWKGDAKGGKMGVWRGSGWGLRKDASTAV